jgi:RimJ/RimL family protein N-acetyltransferase
METIIIRKANLDDLEKLLLFEQEIIETERPFDPTLKEGKIHYYDIEKMILATDVEILVAEINSEIVGSGYARIEVAQPYLQHYKYAYLGFMFTEERFRGKGINAKIIDSLVKWCELIDVFEFRLDVYSQNASAIKAYEKAGFSKYLLNMRKAL